MKRVGLAAVCLLAILVVSGASFEAVMRPRAARDYPAPAPSAWPAVAGDARGLGVHGGAG